MTIALTKLRDQQVHAKIREEIVKNVGFSVQTLTLVYFIFNNFDLLFFCTNAVMSDVKLFMTCFTDRSTVLCAILLKEWKIFGADHLKNWDFLPFVNR